MDKVLQSSSRGQKGRRGKLPCTPETKSTHLKGSLRPGWVIFDKVDICNMANTGSLKVLRTDERKQGEVLRIYKSFGMAKACAKGELHHGLRCAEAWHP